MRNLDNNRVEGFVKKHIFLKRWISVMLVVALLVTCTTMYALNKAASAVSEETAEDVGMVLTGEGSEEGTEEAGVTNEEESTENATPVENSEEGESSEENASASSEEAESANTSEETSSETATSETENVENAENTESSNEGEVSEESTVSEEANAATEGESTEENVAGEEAVTEEQTENTEDNSLLASNNDIELTEDVVLTVSYVNEAAEKIADEKEINLSESLDFTTEAPKQEGYEFVNAAIDGTVITKIVAKKDANDHKYYEVTAEKKETEDSSEETQTIVIKENKTVVLTYKAIEANKTEYVFENEKVRVVATLEKANAIPDDAEFVVTEVTAETEGYDYDAYMKALNDGEESTLSNHNNLNTILYDVAFMVDKKDAEGNIIEGEKVEYQPEEGSVSIKFEFLANQLGELNEKAGEDNNIEVIHMPLDEKVKESVDSTAEATELEASDISTVPVEAEVNAEAEEVEISLDNFSLIGFTTYFSGTTTFSNGSRNLTYTLNETKDSYKESDYYDKSLVFGVAGNFHIVAFDTARLNAHTNGNVLAKMLHTESNFGTNNLEKELSYVQNISKANENMASKEGHTLAIGSNVTLNVTSDHYFGITAPYNGNDPIKIAKPFNIVQDKSTIQNPYIDLNAVKEDITKMSLEMAKVTDGGVNDSQRTTSEAVIKYEGNGGAGYKTYTAAQWNELVSERELKFVFESDENANPEQAIIININCEGADYIGMPNKASTIKVGTETLSTSETTAIKAGRIVYNFYNVDKAKNKNIKLQEIFGQVIALGANLEVNKGNGNFIAENVTISGETHRRDFVGTTKKSAIVKLSATKKVDGQNPTADQVYDFTVEAGTSNWYGNLDWNTKNAITVNNEIETVSADVSDFIEKKEGTYYFRIHEVAKANDASTVYDNTYYVAKVVIKQKTEGSTITFYPESVTYYRLNGADANVNNLGTPINTKEPVFNNSVRKPVDITLYKLLNNENPGDVKFDFVIKRLKDDFSGWKNGGGVENLIHNEGDTIKYSIDPAYWEMNTSANNVFYFKINEKAKEGYRIDKTIFLVKIDYSRNAQNPEVTYWKMDQSDQYFNYWVNELKKAADNHDKQYLKNLIETLTGNQGPKVSGKNLVVFRNYIDGIGNLRIHKMVVNDFGSDFVRDSKDGRALLSNVIFRVTDNKTGNYIVVEGFTGHAKDETKPAKAYAKNGSRLKGKDGKDLTYRVVYNQSAQWTIIGLPAGTYTVEEVADGLTIAYDAKSNVSTPIEATDLSRVTKYDVTVDSEEVGLDTYGIGGENYRMVFSRDLGGEDHHKDLAPTEVLVGSTDINNPSHTQTVQVCNYYSKPIGPIKVFKRYTGGEMTDDMQFTFKIEGAGYTAHDSAGNPISLKNQPMPVVSEKVAGSTTHEYTNRVQDTVTLTLKDMTKQKDGSYTAEAVFASIPFRFEGDYFYKIYENETGIPGIAYDKTVYYIKIHVEKKYTTFSKTYTAENMTHPALYQYEKANNLDKTMPEEDFYYLGATVTYTDDVEYSNVIAICDLSLGKGLNTNDPKSNEFIVTYTKGKVENVNFINTLSGNLSVKKVWLDSDKKDDSANHTSLKLSIWQRVAGTTTWTRYGNDIELGPNKKEPEKSWTFTLTGLPLLTKDGKKYEYCVKEADSYLASTEVTYEYTVNDASGKHTDTVKANAQGQISVDGVTTYDPGYSMHVGADNISYGEVTITNRSLVVNELPAAGGMGTLPFMIVGIAMTIAAGAALLFGRRKKD
ncbi:LPXTG cell wall anchor domain-containing protein [Butyrivibrio sp. INlla16]|uniref:LPXTG cell wall anchor domain-containing protein n=1 Tax=Butyrivibrio sp. INlla16 TaxID=1520807 RepID=UPI000885D482|nr:LPXTG cell wall anchor domain-containing protein [Butyrivibrio sp. INlla16]SDB03133.1 LPXTG-motif cell wall anchor domain-containing protein [Butyrivibrio sp. INlla16]